MAGKKKNEILPKKKIKTERATERIAELKVPESWDMWSDLINSLEDEMKQDPTKDLHSIIRMVERAMQADFDNATKLTQFNTLFNIAKDIARFAFYRNGKSIWESSADDILQDAVIKILTQKKEYNAYDQLREGFIKQAIELTIKDLRRENSDKRIFQKAMKDMLCDPQWKRSAVFNFLAQSSGVMDIDTFKYIFKGYKNQSKIEKIDRKIISKNKSTEKTEIERRYYPTEILRDADTLKKIVKKIISDSAKGRIQYPVRLSDICEKYKLSPAELVSVYSGMVGEYEKYRKSAYKKRKNQNPEGEFISLPTLEKDEEDQWLKERKVKLVG